MEKKELNMETLMGFMGNQDGNAPEMQQRMERLRKLMGGGNGEEAPSKEEAFQGSIPKRENPFENTAEENRMLAMLPLLDGDEQKQLYVLVRSMQLKRALHMEDAPSFHEPMSEKERQTRMMNEMMKTMPKEKREQMANLERLMMMQKMF